MSEEFTSFLISSKKGKESLDNISQIQKKKVNQYDKYIEGTEKISSNPKYIKNFVIKGEVVGRKYFNKSNEIKYLEVFSNKKLNIVGISKNIAFLHLYDKEEKNEYNEDKFIGYRYYEIDPQDKTPTYFTLIKKYDSNYYILEKNHEIKDINDNKFYDNDLDCFSIIKNIILEKYRNKDSLIIGETFPEIIGYCYGLNSIKRFKNFIFLEPLIPEPFNPDSLEEDISNDLPEDIIYLEPLISDAHISLIIFSKISNIRINMIFDMSRYHSNDEHLNSSIYPQSVINYNLRYPKKPIQNYSSCCLWFYGEIECLMSNSKYDSFVSLFNSVKNEKINFYIDIINEISQKFYGINNLFEIVNNIPKKINLDKLYISNGTTYYSVKKNILFTQFLDIENFFYYLSLFASFFDYKILIDSQSLIKEYLKIS